MHVFNSARLRDNEILITAVEMLAPEVICRKVLPLQVCSSSAIEDDNFFFQYVEERFAHCRLIIKIPSVCERRRGSRPNPSDALAFPALRDSAFIAFKAEFKVAASCRSNCHMQT